MNGGVRFKEVFSCKTKRGKAELVQSSDDLSGIGFINQHPDIEILGVARMTMKRYGMTPNNQVANVIIV